MTWDGRDHGAWAGLYRDDVLVARLDADMDDEARSIAAGLNENERLRAVMQEAVRVLEIALGPNVAGPVDRIGASMAYADLRRALGGGS